MTLDLSGLARFRASDLLSAGTHVIGEPVEVQLDQIDVDPEQPRRTFDEVPLAELASSIAEHGILEPVSLRPHPTLAGRYVVQRGERRVRAARLAGRTSVPAFLDERRDPYAQVIENLQREDLSPFDLARFIAAREAAGESRAEIARRLHKTRSYVTEILQLADAPPPVRSAFDTGQARDRRVLGGLTRAMREQPAAVEPLLSQDAPITRPALDRALAAHRTATPGEDGAGRRIQASRSAGALMVEHGGKRGRLMLRGAPGKRTGTVAFEDGTQRQVALNELALVAWTAR